MPLGGEGAAPAEPEVGVHLLEVDPAFEMAELRGRDLQAADRVGAGGRREARSVDPRIVVDQAAGQPEPARPRVPVEETRTGARLGRGVVLDIGDQVPSLGEAAGVETQPAV
jgi:hypothetical protein